MIHPGRIAWRLAAGCSLLVSACSSSANLGAARATNLVVPSRDGLRVVRTMLVVDPLWYKSKLEPVAVMNKVSAEWQREFGIRFRITAVVRDRIPGTNGPGQLDGLIERYPANRDRQLVILFTGSTGHRLFELTEVLGNHVLLCPGRLESAEAILHHGLGHIFGAPHSLMPGNYMTAWAAPLLWSRTAALEGFSRDAHEMIASNKWRIFTLDEPLAQGRYVAWRNEQSSNAESALALRTRHGVPSAPRPH